MVEFIVTFSLFSTEYSFLFIFGGCLLLSTRELFEEKTRIKKGSNSDCTDEQNLINEQFYRL